MAQNNNDVVYLHWHLWGDWSPEFQGPGARVFPCKESVFLYEIFDYDIKYYSPTLSIIPYYTIAVVEHLSQTGPRLKMLNGLHRFKRVYYSHMPNEKCEE